MGLEQKIYGPFFAARNLQTGELYTSLRGRNIFPRRGPLTRSLNETARRAYPRGSFSPEDYEVFEVSVLSTRELHNLTEDSEWLSCLDEAGVDNWPGISFAYQLREEHNEPD